VFFHSPRLCNIRSKRSKRNGRKPALTNENIVSAGTRTTARTAVSVEVGRRPFELIFDDIYSGSRAESRLRRGMPADDELDAIETTNPPALVCNDCDPISDAEVVEPEPDRTDTPHDAMAERAGNGGRRTYTLSDFER
jgi:hypothetical protein